MFHSLKRLSAHLAQSRKEQSVFGYLRKAASEITETNKPVDLESLVRTVSAINSFKYPAFRSGLRQVVLRDNDAAWIEKLTSEADSVAQGKALLYLKALSGVDMPPELLSSLIKRVSVKSRHDIDEFIAAIRQMPASAVTAEVRNATIQVVKQAISNQCHLSTYNSIFDLLNGHWAARRSHLVPIKIRTDLVEAAWSAFMRLDMSGKDAELVAAVKWLALGEPLTGRKDEINEMLTKVELRAKAHLSSEHNVPLLRAIFALRKSVVPEPLDSISQVLSKRVKVGRLTVSELVELVEGVVCFFETKYKAPQLQSIVSSLLPALLAAVQTKISTIPSRALPAVLQLLARATGDHSLVMQELERRGFELDSVQLVQLINSLDFVEPSVLRNLLSADLADSSLVSELVSLLTLKDRIELLSVISTAGLATDEALRILVSTLVQAISESEMDPTIFETETIVKMAEAGDEIFASTHIVPSRLLTEFLASERSGAMSTFQTLRLLRASADADIARCLFDHAAEDLLHAFDAAELLSAAMTTIRDERYIDRALKLLTPLVESATEIDQVLARIPADVADAVPSQYSPANQLRIVAGTRITELASSMSFRSVVACMRELARLDFGSDAAASALIARALELNKTDSVTFANPEDAVTVVTAMREMRKYDSAFLDLVSSTILRSVDRSSGALVAEYACALAAIGNKNESIVKLAEQLLRDSANSGPESMPVRISLLNTLAKSGVFSPLFGQQLRLLADQAAQHVSALSEQDWIRLFETHLAVMIEAPPKIRMRHMGDAALKSFFEDNCAFSWYANQERLRNAFIYSPARAEIADTMASLGWADMRIADVGKEVYHVDFLAAQPDKLAIITVPPADELGSSGGVRVIVGDSMTKIKHLQILGYKVIPVWLAEWSQLNTAEDRKQCLLRNSTQVVFALGANRPM